jgi:glycosyltransferase 2 family protein
MSTGVRTPVWQSLRRWLPGLLISGIALWLVLRTVAWKDVGDALGTMSLGSLVLAVLIYLVSMLARAVCWHTILQRKVPLKRAFFVMNEGYLLNNIFPLRLGEVGRAVLLGGSSSIGILPVFSTIIVERSYDLVIASSLLLSTLPLVLAMDWARPLAFTVLGLVILGLSAVVVMARNRAPVMRWFERLPIRWAFFRNWLIPKFGSVLDGFSVLNRPSFLVISLLLMVSSWGLAILQEFVLLRNVVPDAPLWWVGFALGAAAIGAGLPSVAAAIGVFEAAVVGTLSLVGVPSGKALAFALVVHALQFTISTLMGAIGLALEGENLVSLYSKLTSRKK